ncbi:MAG: transposase, partial [Archaeoglobaceae archaeon]
ALGRLKERGRRVGKLRFKKSFRTMNFNQTGFSIDKNRGKLKLSKIGEIPIKLHRVVRGKVKAVIVKREVSGKWFAILQVDDEPEPLPPTDSVVGIDVGVKHFLTDSNGNQIENPRFYEKTLNRIARLQRELSRKVRGSSNWFKCKERLGRAFERLVNQRNDFLHKLSRYYVDNYGLIAVEDLNISGMSKNRSKLSLRILDASWGKFVGMLSYKAERAGRRVVKVPPYYTSQQNKHIKDRDFRASLNILNKCLSGSGRPSVPVEERPLLRIPAKAVIMGQASPEKQEGSLATLTTSST